MESTERMRRKIIKKKERNKETTNQVDVNKQKMKETGRSIETGSGHLGSSSKAKKQNKKQMPKNVADGPTDGSTQRVVE